MKKILILFVSLFTSTLFAQTMENSIHQFKVEALEGDSFLNMLRANIHYMLIDLDKAIELIEVMMDDYPYSIDAFDTALTLYVEHGKYDKAIEVLNIMNETFELDMDVLKQVVTNGFPEFSKSPQYIKWSK